MKIARSHQALIVAILCTLAVIAAYLLPQAGTFGGQKSVGALSGFDTSVEMNTYRSPVPSIQNTLSEFEKTWKPLDDQAVLSWTTSFLDAKPVPSGAGMIAPATLRAFTNGDQVMVRSAITGIGVVEPSGISLVFDKTTRRAVQSVETTFVQRSRGGTVTTWIDGRKVLDRFVPDQVSSEKNVIVGWNEFTACLNGAGVAAWVVTAITIACSAICIGTVGAGCIPCITAAAGITGGVFYSCAAQALFYS